MRAFTFFRFMRQILRKKPADLDWIQRQGLIAGETGPNFRTSSGFTRR
jgi:hypothetical protein